MGAERGAEPRRLVLYFHVQKAGRGRGLAGINFGEDVQDTADFRQTERERTDCPALLITEKYQKTEKYDTGRTSHEAVCSLELVSSAVLQEYFIRADDAWIQALAIASGLRVSGIARRRTRCAGFDVATAVA